MKKVIFPHVHFRSFPLCTSFDVILSISYVIITYILRYIFKEFEWMALETHNYNFYWIFFIEELINSRIMGDFYLFKDQNSFNESLSPTVISCAGRGRCKRSWKDTTVRPNRPERWSWTRRCCKAWPRWQRTRTGNPDNSDDERDTSSCRSNCNNNLLLLNVNKILPTTIHLQQVFSACSEGRQRSFLLWHRRFLWGSHAYLSIIISLFNVLYHAKYVKHL